MADERAKRDENRRTVILGVTNDSAEDIKQIRVDPTTLRMLVNATITGDISIAKLDQGSTGTVVSLGTSRQQIAFSGGDITIHAQPTWNANGKADEYTLSKNWTEGCIAVSNEEMEKLWYSVREGVPIKINK